MSNLAGIFWRLANTSNREPVWHKAGAVAYNRYLYSQRLQLVQISCTKSHDGYEEFLIIHHLLMSNLAGIFRRLATLIRSLMSVLHASDICLVCHLVTLLQLSQRHLWAVTRQLENAWLKHKAMGEYWPSFSLQTSFTQFVSRCFRHTRQESIAVVNVQHDKWMYVCGRRFCVE